MKMTENDEYALRRKTKIDHIRLLEKRYSEPERREAVALLEGRLARIPGEKAA